MRRLLAISLLTFAASARADDGDGVYGRFDSATSVVVAVGAAVDPKSGNASALVDARVRIVESVGVASSLVFDPGTRTRAFFGLELRPLFPGMFLESMSTGRAYLDLFVQSIGVELGIDAALERDSPLGFVWGLSFEVPLLRPDRFAHGAGIRLGTRHTRWFEEARPNGGRDGDAWTLYAMLTLGLDAGNSVADWEPPRHRHE